MLSLKSHEDGSIELADFVSVYGMNPELAGPPEAGHASKVEEMRAFANWPNAPRTQPVNFIRSPKVSPVKFT